MPETKKKKKEPEAPPTAPPDSTPAATNGSVPAAAPVLYPELKIAEWSTASPNGPLMPDDWVTLLGWETEPQYKARMCAKNPGTRAEQWAFGENGPRREDTGEFQPIHCLDEHKNKVVCWNNANNRPFDMGWCEDIISMVLSGTWAGPHTLPGETVNGETVRIGRSGRMLSGQHQGTGAILADQRLQKARQSQKDGKGSLGDDADTKYPFWKGQEHCFIETIVITGLSEDERVLRTIDYVKPRSVADMLYTMPLFRENNSLERKELTKLLSTAIDTTWNRADTKGYKTHPEVVGFLERHKRLLKAVEHLFCENRKTEDDDSRKISKLRLSPGVCAALCYIMGSSGPKTDGDVYRNESPPSERNLDWEPWDKAREFWARLTTDDFEVVQEALNRLVETTPEGEEETLGLGGRASEKLAILAKAWEVFKEHDGTVEAGPLFTPADLVGPDGVLSLSYSDLDAKGNKLPSGKVRLIDDADFSGIDSSFTGTRGSASSPPMGKPPTREEIEQATREALQRRLEQQQQQPKG